MEELQKILVHAITPKLQPSKYQKILDQAQMKYAHAEVAAAKVLLEKAVETESQCAEALFWLGRCAMEEKEYSAAKDYFEKSLQVDANFYRCLEALYCLAMEEKDHLAAYTYAANMVEKYPLDINRIPEFTRIFIANQKFDDLIDFCKVFDQEEEFDELMKESAAAGLALVGKNLISKGEVAKGTQALERAMLLAVNRPKILKSIAGSFILVNNLKRADEVIDLLPEKDQKDSEIQVLKLTVMNTYANPGDVMGLAYKLLANKVKEQSVYEILIQNSIKVGRSAEKVEEIVIEASRIFPERASYFQALLRKIS